MEITTTKNLAKSQEVVGGDVISSTIAESSPTPEVSRLPVTGGGRESVRTWLALILCSLVLAVLMLFDRRRANAG
jgi:hypothetical protein